MSIFYKGIELEGLDKDVSLRHSMFVEKNENTVYLEKLADVKRSDVTPERFDEINKLYSVVKMNYQVCNGGIGQYFCNGYHKPWISEDKETEIFDKDEQVSMLRKMHGFAIEVFPENSAENSKFARIIDFFESLYLEENVPQMEMIYSDEEEQIEDEDTGEWIDNPDYEEPYEDCVGYEDEIWSSQACYQADSFDKNYYAINGYIEKVAEVYAQFLTKSIERDNSISELLSHDETFRYRMLSRMKMDCNYYLGNGNCYPGHLWAQNEYNQILYMKALWNSFPEDGKPEWLSMEQICEYEKKMLDKQPSLADKILVAESQRPTAKPVAAETKMER